MSQFLVRDYKNIVKHELQDMSQFLVRDYKNILRVCRFDVQFCSQGHVSNNDPRDKYAYNLLELMLDFVSNIRF